MQVKKINFKRERDFSGVFGDSLSFIKQNFKGLFGSIMLIAGPFLLITGLALGYIQSLSSSGGIARTIMLNGVFDFTTIYLTAGVAILFSLLSHSVILCATYEYMLLYDTKLPGEKVTISEVGRKVLSSFGRVIGSTLLLSLVAGIVIGVFVLAAVGIGNGLGNLGVVLLVLLFIFVFFILGPVMIYYFPAGFFVVVRDRINIFSALGNVRRYMSGNFWWTWLIMFVTYIGLAIFNFVFSLPATIVSAVDTFSRVRAFDMNASTDPSMLLIALHAISLILSSVTSTILLVICAFNFMGHEEKHEGTGLMSRIEEIK